MGQLKSPDGWHERAGWHRRIISIGAILVGVVTVAAVLGLLVPLRRMLANRDQERFRTDSRLIHRDVEGFFTQSAQIAAQTPSRTRIREELVAYLQGERTLDAYLVFTVPKLFDAVESAPEMIAVFRFDPAGRLLVRAGAEGGAMLC